MSDSKTKEITVRQIQPKYSDKPSNEYQVAQLINITNPNIGEKISRSRLDSMISEGIKVTIDS